MKPALSFLWWITGALVAAALAMLAGLALAQVFTRFQRRKRRIAERRARTLCLDILAGGHGRLPHIALPPQDAAAITRVRAQLEGLLSQDALARLDEALSTRRVGRFAAPDLPRARELDWSAPPALAHSLVSRL